MSDPDPGIRRGWGWVAHLLAGGTTPWARWGEPGEPRGLFLPGAQQLELLRRVNEAAAAAAGRPDGLAEAILEASAPGRGRPDLELVGAARESAFGPRPVDPGALPPDELIRVATSVLADHLVAVGLPEPPPERVLRPTGRSVARPWRRRYRLVGDPWLADPLRAELVRRGRPPGGSGATVLVLAGPLDRMLADTFTARCFETGVPPWGQWLADLARADTLAPRIDLARVARHWAGVEPGRDRVRIVSDLGRLPRRVGVRRLPVPEPLPGAPVELARRLAGVLSLLVDTATRTALLQQTLLPRLRGRPGPPLGVPEQHRDWVRARALRMQADLAAGGYPVDGRLDDLLPEPASAHRFVSGSPPHRPGGPTDESVLALAVDLLLEGAR